MHLPVLQNSCFKHTKPLKSSFNWQIYHQVSDNMWDITLAGHSFVAPRQKQPCFWQPRRCSGFTKWKGTNPMWKTVHSFEPPSMVDPQWDIWYWGSKWNLHTVCWSAVGCEWGTTSVYFGITYVCFIPSRLPVFAVEPQYLLQDFFIVVKSIIWRTHTKSSKYFMLV